MPDVGIPGAEYIFGKGSNDIARLLSNVSDTELSAKQLKLMYTTGELAEIIGSGYMTGGRAVEILVEAGFTVASAASVMDDAGCGDGRNAEILSDMSVAEAYAQLNHTNLTSARIATTLNHDTAQDLRSKWRDGNMTRTLKVWVSPGCGDINTPRWWHGCISTSENRVTICGGRSSSGLETSTEHIEATNTNGDWDLLYNESVPTYGDLSTAIWQHACTGAYNSGLSCGGNTAIPPDADARVVETEERAGLWTAGGDLNTAINNHACAGFSASAAISFGGDNGSSISKSTEEYNGTTWSAGGDMNTSAQKHAGTGSNTASLKAGGANVGVDGNITEEYDGAAWANGGNLNSTIGFNAMFGIQTLATSFGGQSGGSLTAETEEYDGAAWSVAGVGDMQTARWYHDGGGGTDHGMACGGLDSASETITGDTEEYR